jgi:hypothetical protein
MAKEKKERCRVGWKEIQINRCNKMSWEEIVLHYAEFVKKRLDKELRGFHIQQRISFFQEEIRKNGNALETATSQTHVKRKIIGKYSKEDDNGWVTDYNSISVTLEPYDTLPKIIAACLIVSENLPSLNPTVDEMVDVALNLSRFTRFYAERMYEWHKETTASYKRFVDYDY